VYRIKIMPLPGQQCVWDYPLPPKVEDSTRQITVVFNGTVIAHTKRARRVLEEGYPPVYYIPPEDVRMEHIVPTKHTTRCKFKGTASHCTVAVGDKTAENAGWYYPQPTPDFADIKDYIAFYPSKVDAFLDREKVEPMEGGSYGGWVTKDITGPFKDHPDSVLW